MSTTTTAVWGGPFTAEIAGHGIAQPGDTVKDVPVAMVNASGHWHPATPTKKPAAE